MLTRFLNSVTKLFFKTKEKKARSSQRNPTRLKKKSSSGKKTFVVRKIKTVKESPKKKDQEVLIGEITHYFSRIEVGVIKVVKDSVAIGDMIHIKGSSCDFKQRVDSLQIESIDVKEARRGKLAGLKLKSKAKEGDKVYKVLPIKK